MDIGARAALSNSLSPLQTENIEEKADSGAALGVKVSALSWPGPCLPVLCLWPRRSLTSHP